MIVITGASDGLGKEIAKVYHDTGHMVVNLSRSTCEYATHNIVCDLTDSSSIIAAAERVKAIDETIDAVMNCAGVMSIQPLGSITHEEIERIMQTNINGHIFLISQLSERIVHDQTDVINVASTVGTKGYESQAAYGASKWAMRGFSANLQAEFKGKPNRVISFCVGGMRTTMSEKIGIAINDPENWMKPSDIAVFIKQILDLPKNIEVSEVIINRK